MREPPSSAHVASPGRRARERPRNGARLSPRARRELGRLRARAAAAARGTAALASTLSGRAGGSGGRQAGGGPGAGRGEGRESPPAPPPRGPARPAELLRPPPPAGAGPREGRARGRGAAPGGEGRGRSRARTHSRRGGLWGGGRAVPRRPRSKPGAARLPLTSGSSRPPGPERAARGPPIAGADELARFHRAFPPGSRCSRRAPASSPHPHAWEHGPGKRAAAPAPTTPGPGGARSRRRSRFPRPAAPGPERPRNFSHAGSSHLPTSPRPVPRSRFSPFPVTLRGSRTAERSESRTQPGPRSPKGSRGTPAAP